jgi:hypothetical protein
MMIIKQIQWTYKYNISYMKAWRAKLNVFEMKFGIYLSMITYLICYVGLLTEIQEVIMFALMDLSLHVPMMLDLFPHHRLEGIIDLVC